MLYFHWHKYEKSMGYPMLFLLGVLRDILGI